MTTGPRHKYARIERERRFLLDGFPINAAVIQTRRITDRYIDDTTSLRLRKQIDSTDATTFKLTQKHPLRGSGAQQGFITTMYLSENKFEILARLKAKQLSKTRYSVPPFRIDALKAN